MDIYSKITELKGVGEKTSNALNRLGLYTIEDLLEYYPRNYDIYEAPVASYEVEADKTVAVSWHLTASPEVIRKSRMPVTTLKLPGPKRILYLTWYNMPYLKNQLKVGQTYIFRGKVTLKRSSLTMEQPEIFTPEQYDQKLNSMQPIYPLTEGVTNKLLIKLLSQVLTEVSLTNEYMPANIRQKYHLSEYNYAIQQIHFPKDWENMILARKRLVFDEFFIFILALKHMRNKTEVIENNHKIIKSNASDALINMLPYRLTNAQIKTWNEICKDIAGEKVMNRLIQGDVGSGKTIVAALALLECAKNGYQGCIMAPTEVLARQHYESFKQLLEPFGIQIEILTGSMTAKEKRLANERIKNGQADIVVGTHALIQESVDYESLGLVVTDEQHRFGVRQREILSDKGVSPHVLVMSATPIPRTLAIILYGDLDISIMDELPAKRLPIKNCVVNTSYRNTAYKFIEKEVRAGHQAYVICPMVEESELLDAENVIDYTKKIKEHLSVDIQVEYLHGKQKPKEKNSIMERFSRGEIQVLVSTTVVEVGVNVPNATVMMIENSERFGLAQLHQLRGRVGRGDAQSYCIFINTSDKNDAQKRLDVLVQSNDGFYIAGEDLKLRGPGDLFGLKQSGIMEFKIGDVFNDMDLLKDAADSATAFLEKNDFSKCIEYQFLYEKVQRYMSVADDYTKQVVL